MLIGVGRGRYHTAALVVAQAEASEGELSVTTALFLALMTVGWAIGQSYVNMIGYPIGYPIDH